MYGKKRPDWWSKAVNTMIKNGNGNGYRSSIEIIISEYLEVCDIKFKQNVFVSRYYNVDFLIEDQKIVIECDGCVWHGCPEHFPNEKLRYERTIAKTKALEEMGYKVINIWEHDIRKYNFEKIYEILDTSIPIYEKGDEVVYLLEKFEPKSENSLYEK